MFPSLQDTEAFASEFGRDAVIYRGEKLIGYWEIVAGVFITPQATKERTLDHAWALIRCLARWIIVHIDSPPSVETYCIFVGWSRAVREQRGHIFTLEGALASLPAARASESWTQYDDTTASHHPALRLGWEKDVFA